MPFLLPYDVRMSHFMFHMLVSQLSARVNILNQVQITWIFLAAMHILECYSMHSIGSKSK